MTAANIGTLLGGVCGVSHELVCIRFPLISEAICETTELDICSGCHENSLE
jgi:hypothetical protein